jgi:predicted kinase
MKQKQVFLMSGPPGSGKSTWIKSQLVPGAEWISRDAVRFAIISDGEEYFSHEDDVFDTFINYINQTLDDENIHTIYIDATHLNKRARDNVLRLIHTNKIETLNSVCFITPLEVCLERNAQRTGRALVPDTVIKNMFKSYTIPNKETENFNHIYTIDENNEMKEVL